MSDIIYNTENEKTDYQTGRELHLDWTLNQFLSDSFALGLQGFYLKQISGDSGPGASLGGFKAEAAGTGPGVMWAREIGNQRAVFIAKWLHEFHAERRLEGGPFSPEFCSGLVDCTSASALDWRAGDFSRSTDENVTGSRI